LIKIINILLNNSGYGIECKYKELKSSIEIEEFSGTKPIAIKQDFYASIYLSMVASFIKTDADTMIANDNKHKTLKSEYQANRNFIMAFWTCYFLVIISLIIICC
jgi:hypothetical protein